MTDHQISTLLRESTAGLQPDVLDLVAGGVARGRRSRRRRRMGTAVVTACVLGGLALGVNLVNGSGPSEQGTVADHTSGKPKPAAPKADGGPTPDAALAVAAADVPAVIASMLPPGEVGPALNEGSYPLVNDPDHQIVHFRYRGTLTTFTIDTEASMGTCAEQATPPATCSKVNGLDVLTWPASTADQVTAQGVAVWQHGYMISAISYNAPEGKEVAPLMDEPAIGLDKLTEIAGSDRWFSWQLAQ